MRSLDFLTLHYALVVNCVTVTLIWLGIALAYRDFISARYWMAGSLATTIGAVLLSFSYIQDVPVYVIAGNFLIVIGFSLYYGGLQSFYNWQLRAIFTPLAIVLGISLAVTLVGSDNGLWRAYIYNLTYLVLLISMAVFVITRKDKSLGIYVCVVAIIIGLLCQLYNLLLTFQVSEQIINVAEFLRLYSYNFLMMQLSGGTLTFGFFILTIDALRKEVEYLASRDDLTGLPNRSLFNAVLDSAEQEYLTSGTSYVILMIDIDNFKTFNDQYGHRLGDEVLQHFCTIMTGLLQPDQMMSRHGGDEFCVLMPASAHEAAKALAIAIKRHLSASPLILNGNKALKMTVSTGAAIRTDITEDGINTMFNEADKALYRVKRAGRDGYALYEPA